MYNLAILVISCDKYSDLWPIFFEFKKKYWPDCKYKTYLGSNYKKSGIDNVESISIGEDLSWADNVKKMLMSIDSEYILMLLEDFFIDRRIDNSIIEMALKFAKEEKIDCLRLEPLPPPPRIHHKFIKVGKLNPGAPYYVSTQPAIWKKSVLVELLHEGYSAWEFEQKNSKICSEACKYNFWGAKRYLFHHKNGVERGKYYRSTVDLLTKEGIHIDYEIRGIIEDKRITARISLLKYKCYMWIKRMRIELLHFIAR